MDVVMNTDDSKIEEKTLPEWLLVCNYSSLLSSLLSGSPTAAWVTWSLCLNLIPLNMSGKSSASFLTHLPAGGHRTESVRAFSKDKTARCKNRKTASTEMAHIPIFSLSDHKNSNKTLLAILFYIQDRAFWNSKTSKTLKRYCIRNYYNSIINIIRSVHCISIIFLFL